MKSAFRNALPATLSLSQHLSHTNTRCSFLLNPNHHPLNSSLLYTAIQNVVVPNPCRCHTQSAAESYTALMEKEFRNIGQCLDESGSLRDRIRGIASEIEATNRHIHSLLLLVHQSPLMPEFKEKVETKIDVLKGLFSQLAEIVRQSPEQYYRYHGDWKSETQTVVSLLAFMHWLETGALLGHAQSEQKLGLDKPEFRIDAEDYLIGICYMSNELPRYVVNRVTAGDYNCPRKVMKFLTELHSGFRMLNLRNDLLRKKFDGMKYDLRKVEEVYYDVKIRGLAVNGDATAEQQKELKENNS